MSENNNNPGMDEEIDTFTLALDDGTSLECAVLTELHVDGNDYVVLVPMEAADGLDEDEVLIFRFEEKEGEDVAVFTIESDEEFEKVEEAFDEFLDDLEFNNMDGEE